jgi:outer membrane protein assembly factor BamE (lipoprotein component of BamABCDE complex)
MKKLGIIIASLFIISGCASNTNRGQYVEDAKVARIKISKTTKEDLVENCGTPSFVSEFNKNKWYYVSRANKSNFLNRPKTLSQRVLIVEFDNNNLVSYFEIQDNKNVNITLSGDKTLVAGTEKGLVSSYFSNIGKFSKSDKKKRKNK